MRTQKTALPTLDVLDRKLLWLLDQHGRAPLSVLAHKLRRSQQIVSYRFQRLKQRGLISHGITLINFHLTGTLSFRLYLRLRQIESDVESELCAHLQNRSDVLWFVRLSGGWDYQVVFRLPSYIAFAAAWKEIQAKYGCFYERVDISMTIVTYHFGRDYLVNRRRDDAAMAHFGKAQALVALTPLDRKLLSLIAADCRMPTSELQRRLECGHQKLIERFRYLESSGVVQSYRVSPKIHLLGRRHIKALMKLTYDGPKSEAALYSFVARYPHVVYLSEVLGSWQFEIECEVVDQSEVLDMLRDTRRAFPKLVRDYELVEVSEEFVLNYGPGTVHDDGTT